ncbi:hypothetical protein BB559_003868 [Furculomyces boomerangus]|uniref:Methyltransferase type 11 domain-containing protein n=1 Tax=Furculomyces boomerangus TaxID=61424 RepID=A0A2T9YI77_9FUNG|nr:hypothetical protein BB559_003868 [Furculomyces boomerangus]
MVSNKLIASVLGLVIVINYITTKNKSNTILRKFSDFTFSFAWRISSSKIDQRLKIVKERLFGDVNGNVLEIGPGYGSTLKFLDISKISKYTCLEPSAHFHDKLKKEGLERGFTVESIDKNSPKFPEVNNSASKTDSVRHMLVLCGFLSSQTEIQKSIVDNGPYDAIISTLVLCSVDDVEESIKTVLKLLKPGGKLYFIEHVSTDKRESFVHKFFHYFQEFITPAWGLFGGNCHLNRETFEIIKSFPEWESITATKISEEGGLVSNYLAPIYYGCCSKRKD